MTLNLIGYKVKVLLSESTIFRQMARLAEFRALNLVQNGKTKADNSLRMIIVQYDAC